jgi:hypothetical protein
MDRSDAKRIIHALEAFAADGRGDVKALKGALKGRCRASSALCQRRSEEMGKPR